MRPPLVRWRANRARATLLKRAARSGPRHGRFFTTEHGPKRGCAQLTDNFLRGATRELSLQQAGGQSTAQSETCPRPSSRRFARLWMAPKSYDEPANAKYKSSHDYGVCQRLAGEVCRVLDPRKRTNITPTIFSARFFGQIMQPRADC